MILQDLKTRIGADVEKLNGAWLLRKTFISISHVFRS